MPDTFEYSCSQYLYNYNSYSNEFIDIIIRAKCVHAGILSALNFYRLSRVDIIGGKYTRFAYRFFNANKTRGNIRLVEQLIDNLEYIYTDITNVKIRASTALTSVKEKMTNGQGKATIVFSLNALHRARCTNCIIEDKAATKIQSVVRAKIAERRFRIKPSSPLTNYQVLALGNDPVIYLNQYRGRFGQNFMFIGTSGVRSLLLCLELLGQIEHQHAYPLLLIVDNSKLVRDFWRDIRRNIREIIKKNYSKCAVIKANNDNHHFFNDNAIFSVIAEELGDDNSIYPEYGSIESFFDYISEKFDCDAIINIVERMIIVPTTWQDKSTFQTIKRHRENRILNGKLPALITYASNIIEFVLPDDRQPILENIYLLKPNLTIHTVSSIKYAKVPTKFLFFENSNESTAQIENRIMIDSTYPRK